MCNAICAPSIGWTRTHHAPPAVFAIAKHGLFPVDSSESAVEAVHQLLPVLQLDQLEGLFAAHADYDGVGKRAGALRFLYG